MLKVKHHKTGERVTFSASRRAIINGIRISVGSVIEVVLCRDWDDSDGLHEGGPWSKTGWHTGYTTEKVKEIATQIRQSDGVLIYQRD